jgi:hypothetical protein
MKRHAGWLAAGLVLFAVLACNLSKNNNSNNSNNSNSNSNKNSNTNTQPTRAANAEIYVDRLSMAKDDNGKPGETTTTFEPADHTIHCVADLNKARAGTKIKFVWKAIDVPTEKNEDIKTIDYSTKSFEDKVHAHLTLPRDWPKGTYGVDVYINGALDKTIKYTVE